MTEQPLRVERSDAWAELQQTSDDTVVLEMRDRSHHHIVRVDDRDVVTVAGAEWWFLAGALPDGAHSVELHASGERYEGGSHAGCWLAALPRDVVVAHLELVALDAQGQRLRTLDLGPVVNPPPRPAVPRAELAPDQAPVMLRFGLERRLLRSFLASIGFWLALAIANLALDERGYAYLALIAAVLTAALYLQPLLPKVYDLRLDRHGFMWRGRLWQACRFRWNDVEHFRPVGKHLSDVGFDLARARPVPWSARINAALVDVQCLMPSTYGLDATELAALMNAWREHYYAVTS